MLKRTSVFVGLGAAAICLAPVSVEAHGGAADRILVPIGGDYTTNPDFARVVISKATGQSVDFLVGPTAYAETKEEAIENGDYDLALERTADLQAACAAIVDTTKFPQGCHASLLDLWSTPDASSPAVLAALSSSALDGVYFLGGDQGAAMAVIAGTPAEAKLGTAYKRGVIVGGTSAGNAIESRTMSNGYTDYGDASVGLHIGAVDMWYGDPADPTRRGLDFGSQKAMFDQHLYERGRFGRLLNETAQTADHFGNYGLVGVGADLDTALVVKNDKTITEIFGYTSVTITDFRSLGSKWKWLDADGEKVTNPSPIDTPTAALSVQNVLTHLLAPKAKSNGKSAITYDLDTRLPTLNGVDVRTPPCDWSHFSADKLRADKAILVGGDLSVGPDWPTDSNVLREFISRADSNGDILIVTAAYSDTDYETDDIQSYKESLQLSGWTGGFKVKRYPETFTNAQLNNAAGVIFLGGNQENLPAVLANTAYVAFLKQAHTRAPIVFYEHAFAAAAGDYYDAIDDAADWIEAYKADQAVVKKGLGIVISGKNVAFEPRVQYDYKYGRFWGIPNALPANKRPIVFGISEGSALLVTPNGAKVVGVTPVFQVDPEWATFYVGDNGAIGALNTVVDAYEPSQRLQRYGNRRTTGGFWWRDRSDDPRRRQH